MISMVKDSYDRFRGSGAHALTVPPLDGAFRANSSLDAAPVVLRCHDADNVVLRNGALHFSSGGTVLRMEADGSVDRVLSGVGEITAMAAGPGGQLAIAHEGGAVTIVSDTGKREIAPVQPGSDVTALCFLRDGGLAAANGAEGLRFRDWRRDLMLRGRTGSVWRLPEGGDPECMSRRLAYPIGLLEEESGALLVSLAWDHAVARLEKGRRPQTVLGHLPAYPARLAPAAGGGYWLSFLSVRNQLVEFALGERRYVERMLAEIEPEYWLAPALSPPDSPLAPMQAGAERHHGEMKPWAPSLSYGLIARIGPDHLPRMSLHSRADGNRHGLTSLAADGDTVFASSRGAGGIIRIETEGAT